MAQPRVRWCRAGLSVEQTEPPLRLPFCSRGVKKVNADTPVFPMQLEAHDRHKGLHFPKCLHHPLRAPEQGREKPLPGDGSHLSFSESPLKFDFSLMNTRFSTFRIASPCFFGQTSKRSPQRQTHREARPRARGGHPPFLHSPLGSSWDTSGPPGCMALQVTVILWCCWEQPAPSSLVAVADSSIPREGDSVTCPLSSGHRFVCRSFLCSWNCWNCGHNSSTWASDSLVLSRWSHFPIL